MKLLDRIKWEWNTFTATQEEARARNVLRHRVFSAHNGEYRSFIGCIGTALYIAGATNEEKYIDPEDDYDFIKKCFKNFKRVDKPIIGAIATREWKNNKDHAPIYIQHMCVVSRIGPLKIIHRDLGDKLEVDIPLEKINFLPEDLKYYIPKIGF